MNVYDRIQNSINFIDENLTNDITLIDVANKAYCSLSYFHQLFHTIIGYSLKEYIRKRRLAEAAYELIFTKNKILDIALTYQYETAESFTRAFNKMYGLTPSMYRKNNNHVVFFKNIKGTDIKYINLKGDFIMEPKIIEKDEFKVLGIEVKTSFENKNFPELIHNLWDNYFNNKIGEKTPNKTNSNATLGMTTDYDGNGGFSYFICKEVTNLDDIPQEMVSKVIPSSKYAVFTAKGEDKKELGQKLGQIWNHFFQTWLPMSGYTQRGLCKPGSTSPYDEKADADFELYDERFTDNGFEVDVYIPII